MTVEETGGVVLEIELAISEGADGIIAIIFGYVWTDFVPIEVEEVELVEKGGRNLFFRAFFPD